MRAVIGWGLILAGIAFAVATVYFAEEMSDWIGIVANPVRNMLALGAMACVLAAAIGGAVLARPIDPNTKDED
jgi:hypothetical protein